MARDTWNDATIYTLKKLWAAGVTAEVIAARIGNVTRAAVCGKIHRLGLSLDPIVAKARQQTGGMVGAAKQRAARKRAALASPKAAAATPTERKPAAPVPDDPAIYAAARKPLRDLEPNECKWPIGDPQDKRFGFCAGDRVAGKPYCEAHCRVAYQAPEVVRRQAAERRTERAGEMRRLVEVAK